MTDHVTIKGAIDTIDSLIDDPRKGLPEEVFLFASRITPLVNVDLLIKNGKGETLLTWRDDGHWKPGWHIPGGIIRYQEPMTNRIRAVGKIELGAEVEFQPHPLTIKEIIIPGRSVRGHFISFLFSCSLTTAPDSSLEYRSGNPLAGQWMWHQGCPEDLLEVHEIYREYI